MLHRKGFTLIEILVVIVIIGVLSALIIVNFNAARARARDAQRKSDLREIKSALMMYRNDFDKFSNTGTANVIAGCTDGITDCTWGSIWQTTNVVYMKILPNDPLAPNATYKYSYDSTNDDFCLWATLENKGDSDITSTQTRCSCGAVTGVGDYYVVCAD